MRRETIETILRRDLGAVRRSIEAYPDDDAPWAERPGLPNAGGTLVLHLAGNLQHFVGAILGGSGYRRDREAEFARRGVPRSELVSEVDAAERAVILGLGALQAESFSATYPEPIAGRTVVTGDFLVHLATHLAYHLGQLDYHRRVVTGERQGVGAIAAAELPAAPPRSAPETPVRP
jgi:hypothetical protein